MKIYEIYTDGSHLDKQHSGRLGVGGVIVDPDTNTKVAEFSMPLLPEYMEMTYGTRNCSNPSAELMAVLVALQEFKPLLKNASGVIIKADYIGVREWMTGAWRIKEPYIAKIKSDIDSEIFHQGLKGKIKYEWIKGHQTGDTKDANWNNYVDKLAKGL